MGSGTTLAQFKLLPKNKVKDEANSIFKIVFLLASFFSGFTLILY